MSFNNIFKPQLIYLKLFKDEIELINMDTGRNVTRKSLLPFSSQRLIIANINVAEQLISQCLEDIGMNRRLRPPISVVIHPLENTEGGISQVERVILKDLVAHIGGRFAYVCDHPEPMSMEEVRSYVHRDQPFRMKSMGRFSYE